MTRRVTVLMGGTSAEREVSLTSGRAVADALVRCGHRVDTVDVGPDVAELVAHLHRERPDAVFNALHGRHGEDGCIQGLLELMRLPYTHSGVAASALAMDKWAALGVFRANGLPVPEGRLVSRAEAHLALDPPYVMKPPREGSSVGVEIVRAGDNRGPLAADWEFGEQVLVERYVPGRELTVAVMENRALGVLEIRPRAGFYTYDSKYAPGGSEHLMPAPIHPEAAAEACRIAVEAHHLLGCRGVTRADLRYDDTDGEPGRLVLLEVNTQPGMTPTSLVPEIAEAAGIGFDDLVDWMVETARCDG